MMNVRLLIAAAAVASLCACAHAEMTGDEHRAAAVGAEQKAAVEESKYDPNAVAIRPLPHTPVEMDPVDTNRKYNPTDQHLAEADRQMKKAFEHEKAAERLEKYEDAACAGVSIAERTSCPVLAPHVAAVEETVLGITLHLKAGPRANQLAAQLQCHLAFAKANDFVSVPCPLFIRGVSITLREGTKLDINSADPKVAAQLRLESRRMFGQTGAPVAQY